MSKGKADRYNSRDWRKLSAKVISEEPICRIRLPGCTIRSTTTDHIIPRYLRPDLLMVRSNLRGACRHCNGAMGRRMQAALPAPKVTTPQVEAFFAAGRAGFAGGRAGFAGGPDRTGVRG